MFGYFLKTILQGIGLRDEFGGFRATPFESYMPQRSAGV